MTEQDVLQQMQKTEALLTGHFELRSGLHSKHFFQCANLLRYPEIAGQLCNELVRRMRADFEFGALDGVLAPALGGILVGYEVARALQTLSIFAEKQDDKLVMRRFQIKKGGRYVVAEDVITRGGRVQESIDIIEKAGGVVVAVLVLVDRSGGLAKFAYPTFSLLQMAPQVWSPAECPLCQQGLPLVHPGS